MSGMADAHLPVAGRQRRQHLQLLLQVTSTYRNN